jgi:hypothetical protein
MSVGTGRQNIIILFRIHKWETDIYIGFSPALHLQCTHILCNDWVVSSDKCHYVASLVLLHNGGFCNKCTPKRCLHILVNFQTPLSHKGYMRSLEFYENYITLFCLGKKLFDHTILTMHGILPKLIELTI